MIKKDLIDKFLKGSCTKEEALYVSSYLKRYPDSLEENLPKEEWDHYLEKYHIESNTPLHANSHFITKNSTAKKKPQPIALQCGQVPPQPLPSF